MSLLIWLPLHGNLNNYGSSPITFSVVTGNGGISAASSGGKTESSCYQRTATNGTSYITSSSNLTLSNDFTMACWCYATTAGAVDSANGIITNHNHSTVSGAGITLKYDGATKCYISCNTGNGSNRTYHTYYGTTNIYGAWHHLCLTYDKSATLYRLYVDGICEKEFTYGNSAQANKFNLFDWSTGHSSNGSYKPVAKLNDVRVYDQCLSKKEVKLLSQGLVAHYKLNGGGANNLLVNTTNPQSAANLVSATTTGFSIVPEYALDANVFQSMSSTSAERFIYSSRTPVISKSTSYTFSCDLWANDYVKNIDLFWLSDTDATQKTGSSYVNVTSTTRTIPKRNGWFHVTWTFTTKADDRTGYIRIDNNGSSVDGTDAILRATNLKLEKGTKETGYSMSPSEVLFTVADDSSGYKHNGTTSGTFNYDTDSPRYQCCAIFDGSTTRIHLPIKSLMTSVLKDKCTINFWVNEANTSSRSIYFGGYSGSNFNIEMSSAKLRVYWNGSPDISVVSVSNNVWAMFTIVIDVATGIKIYKNGSLAHTYSGALTDITSGFTNDTFRIGSDSRTGDTMMEGKMSDFRIYCSALSAEDVLTLYQSAGSATRDGGLIAYEFQESMNAPAKIQRTGIFNAKNFSEKGFLPDVKITTLPDNSAWARVFYHKNHAGTVLFTSVNEVLNTNTENKFSCLYLLDQLKGSDGKYEFMLTFPAQHAGKYNRWKQTNNPCKEYVATTSDGAGVAAGYTAVHIDWTSNYWGGLTRQNSSETTLGNTYLSGSVGHSNWFYAIGAASKHDGGIPGPSGGTQETELWVRIDTLPSLQKLSILKEQFVTTSLLHEI